MEHRVTAAVGMLVSTLLGAGVVPLVGQSRSSAQKSWTVPRTPWGDPDLEGIWPGTDTFGVPFERPAGLAGQSELTDKEFAEREAQFKRDAALGSEEIPSTAARSADLADQLFGPWRSVVQPQGVVFRRDRVVLDTRQQQRARSQPPGKLNGPVTQQVLGAAQVVPRRQTGVCVLFRA